MTKIAVSTDEICNNLLTHCDFVYQITVGDLARLNRLDTLAKTVIALNRFVGAMNQYPTHQ
jgi:hypothetical protein